MHIYYFKNKIINIIMAVVFLIIAGIFGVLSIKLNPRYMKFVEFFLAISALYFVFFIVAWISEAKEKNADKAIEEEIGVGNSISQEEFKAIVTEYVYTNQWNLPGFVIDIKSGSISIGDKVLLPNNKKTKVTNIFFSQDRKPTRTAYAGERVKIILYGVRDNKDLDKGMEISK